MTAYTASPQITGNKMYTIVRTQFPLQPAAGRTIHHVQGQSLPAIGVSFIGSYNAVAGLVYLAFSRVGSYLGLFLEGFKPEWIRVNQLVVDEMRRLRKPKHDARLAVMPIFLRTTPTSVSLCTHNVQSLAKYSDNVAASCVAQCDISALQQTRLQASDAVGAGSLPSYFCVRNDSVLEPAPGSRPARGSLLHTHKRFGPPHDSICTNTELFELTAVLVNTCKQLGRNTIAINLYISSPTQKDTMADVVDALTKTLIHFREEVATALVVIMGDFNCDAHRPEDASAQSVLADFMHAHGLHHISAGVIKTHDARGALDQVG